MVRPALIKFNDVIKNRSEATAVILANTFILNNEDVLNSQNGSHLITHKVIPWEDIITAAAVVVVMGTRFDFLKPNKKLSKIRKAIQNCLNADGMLVKRLCVMSRMQIEVNLLCFLLDTDELPLKEEVSIQEAIDAGNAFVKTFGSIESEEIENGLVFRSIRSITKLLEEDRHLMDLLNAAL